MQPFTMPSLDFLAADSPPRVGTATLEETSVTVDEIFSEEFGRMQMVIVSYTLSTEDETFTHMFQFYTDDYDPESLSGAWGDYIELITRPSIYGSIIYHVKRNGHVMCEFTELCRDYQKHAAQA